MCLCVPPWCVCMCMGVRVCERERERESERERERERVRGRERERARETERERERERQRERERKSACIRSSVHLGACVCVCVLVSVCVCVCLCQCVCVCVCACTCRKTKYFVCVHLVVIFFSVIFLAVHCKHAEPTVPVSFSTRLPWCSSQQRARRSRKLRHQRQKEPTTLRPRFRCETVDLNGALIHSGVRHCLKVSTFFTWTP